MKIVTVVYLAECDPYKGVNYMGENSWSVGDTFTGTHIRDK